MMLLPKRRAWIRPVNVDCRWIIIALHFSGCGTIKFLSHHSWSSARTFSSVFVSKSIVSAIQYIVGRLHTYKFLQSVVILRGRLSRTRELGSEDRPLRHSVSYNVCIGVASVDSDELSSF